MLFFDLMGEFLEAVLKIKVCKALLALLLQVYGRAHETLDEEIMHHLSHPELQRVQMLMGCSAACWVLGFFVERFLKKLH